MSDETSQTITRLEAALASGRLTGSAQATAARLLNRLTSPVRVTIIGARHSGSVEHVDQQETHYHQYANACQTSNYQDFPNLFAFHSMNP